MEQWNNKDDRNNKNEDNDWVKKIFSTKGILIAILLLMGYWVFSGGNNKTTKNAPISYDAGNVPIGVSDSLNQAAIDRLGVDLTENLDPKLIPALIADSIKTTSESNLSEKEFMPALVSNISNKIRDISTIDLNADGLADPVLVVPQGDSSGGEFLRFSIRVPDPEKVTTLPDSTNQDEWRDIVENRSIEVMTASAVKNGESDLTMQSTPNPQVYQSSGTAYPNYYRHSPSMSSILMTSMMMHWMFTPRFGYGGFGGGFGSPMSVSTVTRTRGATTSGLSKAAPSSTSAKTASGKNVSNRNFKKTSPKSLNKAKTAQYKKSNANRASRSGGFGKTQAAKQRASASRPSSRSSVQKRSPARRGGFGNSRSRSRGFGGFGNSRSRSRGFGGFGGRRGGRRR